MSFSNILKNSLSFPLLFCIILLHLFPIKYPPLLVSQKPLRFRTVTWIIQIRFDFRFHFLMYFWIQVMLSWQGFLCYNMTLTWSKIWTRSVISGSLFLHVYGNRTSLGMCFENVMWYYLEELEGNFCSTTSVKKRNLGVSVFFLSWCRDASSSFFIASL